MTPDVDKLLSRLVVLALTIFLVTGALLAALVVRQHLLQQRLAVLSSDVEYNLETLEETTEEIQRELSEIRATPINAQTGDDWEGISEALEDVDQQLDALGEDLNEVALALEPQPDVAPPLLPGVDPQDVPQDQVDQVFTLFAILIAVAAILIALLLAIALRIHETTP